jgi:excisionase family DNA binding protein
MSNEAINLSPIRAQEPLLTVEEVSRILKCAEAHVRKLIHLGLLRASRIGIGIRIRGEDLEGFLAAHQVEGPDPRRDPLRRTRSSKPKLGRRHLGRQEERR